jgi:hypothetical protein
MNLGDATWVISHFSGYKPEPTGTRLNENQPHEQRGRKVVARDGIEPPTPAFSGLRSTS